MLTRTATGWSFESESALERVVWENLTALFPVQRVARQLACRGEICDIIAVGSAHELIILELKNTEDRYLVQQLTRYYHNLIEAQPFGDHIDYTQPVRLIGIAPTFHRHNQIDRLYSRLTVEFHEFSIIQDSQQRFQLQLRALGDASTAAVNLAYTEVKLPPTSNRPVPPQPLLDVLGGLSRNVRRGFLAIREQLLHAGEMEETTTAQSIRYGKHKQMCAEFYFDRKTQNCILFLWIPLWRHGDRLAIGRHRIWTNWQIVTDIAHVPVGLGTVKPLGEWQAIAKEKERQSGKYSLVYSKKCADSFSADVAKCVGCHGSDRRLTTVVDLAVQNWLVRVRSKR